MTINKKNKNIHIRVREDYLDALKQYCNETEQSVSNALLSALDKKMKKHYKCDDVIAHFKKLKLIKCT